LLPVFVSGMLFEHSTDHVENFQGRYAMKARSIFAGRGTRRVLAGVTMGLVLGWAQATPATQAVASPQAAEDKPVPAAKPQKRKPPRADYAPHREPNVPKRTPSVPLPPLPPLPAQR